MDTTRGDVFSRSSGDAVPAQKPLRACDLGDAEFKKDYGLKYAYVAGAMYKGIASAKLVTALGRAGLLGYFGTGGLSLEQIDAAIGEIQSELTAGQPYGMNLLCNPSEQRTVALFSSRGVHNVEAAGFHDITASLAWFRLKGVTRQRDGTLLVPNRILAKVAQPEVALAFMLPAPEELVRGLVAAGQLTREEADLGRLLPMSDDICVEADSAGHTRQASAYTLVPAIVELRDRTMATRRYDKRIRVGACGGIGTPHAAAAAFMLGADFVLTGSINQCTVEAGTSSAVKDLLQQMGVGDTAYAPSADMQGGKVQVLSKDLRFAERANRLYELYSAHAALEDMSEGIQHELQRELFKRTFAEVWEETTAHYRRVDPQKIAAAQVSPRKRMELIFRWYFFHSARLALEGNEEHREDYQIHCGPALGAFNQWVRGTRWENWRDRKVAEIAEHIMVRTAALLAERFAQLTRATVT